MLTDKSKIGSVLISYLKQKRNYFCNGPEGDQSVFTTMKVAVPWAYQKNFGSFINYESQMRFNGYLRKDFIEKMCDYVSNNQMPEHSNIYKSILVFREKYGICEDDLAFKTMQKWWEREGKKTCA